MGKTVEQIKAERTAKASKTTKSKKVSTKLKRQTELDAIERTGNLPWLLALLARNRDLSTKTYKKYLKDGTLPSRDTIDKAYSSGRKRVIEAAQKLRDTQTQKHEPESYLRRQPKPIIENVEAAVEQAISESGEESLSTGDGRGGGGRGGGGRGGGIDINELLDVATKVYERLTNYYPASETPLYEIASMLESGASMRQVREAVRGAPAFQERYKNIPYEMEPQEYDQLKQRWNQMALKYFGPNVEPEWVEQQFAEVLKGKVPFNPAIEGVPITSTGQIPQELVKKVGGNLQGPVGPYNTPLVPWSVG